MTQTIACADGRDREHAVTVALAAVRRGDLVVVPTEGVYAIVTDAFSARGVARLREAKGYASDAPIPVFVGARATVGGVAAAISSQARDLMDAFWPGELTLLLRPQPTLAWDLPRGQSIAVRMPLHPLTLALLSRSGPLVGTSANAPGLPAPTTATDAVTQLGAAVSIALDAGALDAGDADESSSGRPGTTGSTLSTIVDCTVNPIRVVRQGVVTVADIERVCPGVLAEASAADA